MATGTIIASDAFTGANGTQIQNHALDVAFYGEAWVASATPTEITLDGLGNVRSTTAGNKFIQCDNGVALANNNVSWTVVGHTGNTTSNDTFALYGRYAGNSESTPYTYWAAQLFGSIGRVDLYEFPGAVSRGTYTISGFSVSQDYTIELSCVNNIIKVYVDGVERISYTAENTVTNITKANPAKVTTSSAHGLSTGAHGNLSGIVGMTELNGWSGGITVTSTTEFTLDGVNSTAYNTYTSGGTFAHPGILKGHLLQIKNTFVRISSFKAQYDSYIAAQTIAVNQTTETNLAQAIAVVVSAITIAIGQPAEVDAAQVIAPYSGTTAIGQAVETDFAQAINGVSGAFYPVGQATETDVAQAMVVQRGVVTITVGQVTEIDSAQLFGVGTPTAALKYFYAIFDSLTGTPRMKILRCADSYKYDWGDTVFKAGTVAQLGGIMTRTAPSDWSNMYGVSVDVLSWNYDNYILYSYDDGDATSYSFDNYKHAADALTDASIATQVRTEFESGNPVPVNVKRINGTPINGDGSGTPFNVT